MMNPGRKAIVALALVGSTITGGAIGATLFGPSAANAANTTTTIPSGSSSTSSGTQSPSSSTVTPGTFHSNEEASHEATESAAREAAENSGQIPAPPANAGAPAAF